MLNPGWGLVVTSGDTGSKVWHLFKDPSVGTEDGVSFCGKYAFADTDPTVNADGALVCWDCAKKTGFLMGPVESISKKYGI